MSSTQGAPGIIQNPWAAKRANRIGLPRGARKVDGRQRHLHSSILGPMGRIVAATSPMPQAPHSRLTQALDPALRGQEHSQVRALLSLLVDDSPKVAGAARHALRKLGKAALPGLNQAARSPETAIRVRARQVLLERQREKSTRRLIRYATRAEHDLEVALFLLDGHHSPGADLRAYVGILDQFGERLKDKIRTCLLYTSPSPRDRTRPRMPSSA